MEPGEVGVQKEVTNLFLAKVQLISDSMLDTEAKGIKKKKLKRAEKDMGEEDVI